MARKDGGAPVDPLDSIAPSTLEEATGSGPGTVVAIREVDLEEPVSSFRGLSSTPHFTSSDLQWPQLRLAQGLTAEVTDGVASMGQWLLPGEEAVDSYTIVPILAGAGRILRDQSEGGRRLCYSDDRVTGIGDPGGACDICPLANWAETQGKDGRIVRIPPPCHETYTYLVYVEEADTLATLTFQRTQLPIGKKFNTFIMRFGLGNFGVTLGSTKTKGNKGTFATPTVNVARVSDETLVTARELANPDQARAAA